MNYPAITEEQASPKPSPARSPLLLASATHAAAHAIVSLSQDRYVEEIWVKMVRRRCIGRVVYQPLIRVIDLSDPPHPYAVEMCCTAATADCLGYLAGPIAEMRCRGASVDQILLIGDQYCDQSSLAPFTGGETCGCDVATDLRRTELLLRWAYGAETPIAFLEAWQGAVSLVVEHWALIEKLGQELAKRRRLSGDEITAILGSDIERTVH